jgi:hypothetical protein
MMTPAWIVYAWPRILCEAQAANRLHFAHLSTSVLVSGGASRPAMGQTLWLGEDDKGPAGVAWDWISVSGGVVAMVDPMALVTNLQFLNTEGEVLAPMESARQLNEIVHALPWQDEVQKALATPH